MTRRQRLRLDERGTSLAEVLIAVAITMGLLTAITGFVVATQRASRQSEARSDDTGNAREAAFAITRALRAAAGPTIDAPAFVSGDDDSVVFFTNIDNALAPAGIEIGAPDRYTYSLVPVGNGRFDLVEQVLSPNPAAANSTAPPAYTGLGESRRRVLARQVVRLPDQPVFLFSDINGQRLGAAAAGERQLRAADLAFVTAVELQLAVQTRTSPAVQPTIIDNRVRISNAYFQGSWSTMTFRRRDADDQGLALISVILATTILTALVLVSTSYAISSQKAGRNDQDRQAALAAAEAGVDHYLQKLNDNNTYYLTLDCANAAMRGPTTGANSCGWTPATPASYIPVPGRPNAGEFHYSPATESTVSTGSIALTSTGRVNGEERTVLVNLRRASFLDFLYYSDKETLDPPLQAAAPNCDRYRYAGRGATCSVIRWVSQDNLLGPLHTNDALVVDGTPTFNGEVTTAWADPSGKNWVDFSGSSSVPRFLQNAGNKPLVKASLPLPESNVLIKRETDPAFTSTPGCRYTGPTRILLKEGTSAKGDGRMEVYSPKTVSVNPGCPLNGSGNLPANGVIYVEPVPGSVTCSNTYPFVTDGQGHGYPQPGDTGTQPTYQCRQATAFVSGKLDGQLTIASEHSVVVVDNTTYESGTCSTCTDVLGLVGTEYVWVYHPIRGLGSNLLANDLPLPGTTNRYFDDVRIDAAIASNNHSFMVQNYASGARRGGALNVTGAIIQKYRGPVGTSSGATQVSGYAKNYVYDKRLKVLSPPFFIKPDDTAWQVNSYSEQ